MAGEIKSYNDFREQAHVLDVNANKSQNVSTKDLEKLGSYLGTDDAKKNLTQGQIDTMKGEIRQLDMIVSHGEKAPSVNANGSESGLSLGSATSNAAWKSQMESLFKTMDAASDGSGTSKSANITDQNGVAIAGIPAGSPLATAASTTQDGVKPTVTPVTQADGRAMDMFLVKDKAGNQQMYGGDGNPIGTPMPAGGFLPVFKISNPATGQDAFVKMKADGTAKTGKDLASLGITETNYPVQNITGTGVNGGYTTGSMGEINAATGVATDATAGQATGLQAGADLFLNHKNSDFSKAGVNLEGKALGIDPTTGYLAASVQDPVTKTFSIKYFDRATGDDKTQEVNTKAAADASQKPIVSLGNDGSIEYPKAKS